MDFIPGIGAKRSNRRSGSSRRSYNRRSSISSVNGPPLLSSINLSRNFLKKQKPAQTTTNGTEQPNGHTVRNKPSNISINEVVSTQGKKLKPEKLRIDTSFAAPTDLYRNNGGDVYAEVARHLNLDVEKLVSISLEHSTSASKTVSSKKLSDTTINTKKSAPGNYTKILYKQKQKGITYELMIEISYYIKMSESWLERFIKDGEMQVIANELNRIHQKKEKTQDAYKLELEILKCLNNLMNKQSGLREAFQHPDIIYNLCFSLISPYIPSRTQACESLTAFCFLPHGRDIVLQGMDFLMKSGTSENRFESWIHAIEKTLDGRGKMGSAVGASSDLRMTGMVGTGGDTQITQYLFISVLFMNTLLRSEIVEDRKERITLNRELQAVGLEGVFRKMELLNHEQITLAIQKYRDDTEADIIQEDIIDMYNSLNPKDVLERILMATQTTESYLCIHNILCYLLKIQDDPSKSFQQYQIIELLIQRIVLDQRSYQLDELPDISDFKVRNLIPKFSRSTDNNDDAIVALEANVEYLEKELEMARQTNAMLKVLLKDTEEYYKGELSEAEGRMRKLHGSIRNLTEYGNPSVKRRSFRGQQQQSPMLQTPTNVGSSSANPQRSSWSAVDTGGLPSRIGLPSSPQQTAQQYSQGLDRRLSGSGNNGFSGTLKQTFRTKFGNLVRRTSNDTVSRSSKSRGSSIDSATSQLKSPSPITVPLKQASKGSVNSHKDSTTTNRSETETGTYVSEVSSLDREDVHSSSQASSTIGSKASKNSMNDDGATRTSEERTSEPVLAINTDTSKEEQNGNAMPTVIDEEALIGPTDPPAVVPAPLPPPPPPPPAPPAPTPNSILSDNEDGNNVPSPPTFLGMTGRKPSAFQSKQRLKYVEWEKMNFSNIQQTIWQEFGMDSSVSNSRPSSIQKQFDSTDSLMEYQLAKAGVFDEVELAFAQKPAVEIKTKQIKEEIQILETKKAYNLNIFIKSIIKKIPFNQIHYYFLLMDPYFADEQVLINLSRYLPSDEEAAKLRAYMEASEDEISKLGVPEKFCLQMLKTKRLKERLECMLFKANFLERFTLLHKQMTSVYNASIALKDAKKFKELLHLILVLGNFLNGNTYRGGAFGIKIASINKLKDTKGTSKSTTFLHFLVDAVEKNFQYVLTFLEELDECGSASKVSKTEVTAEYQAVEKELCKLETELRNHYPLKNEDEEEEFELDKFAVLMHQFLKEASAEFKRIKMLFNKMEESYDQVVRFYGEDPRKMQPNEFFGIFKEFTDSWEKCSSDSKVLRQKQERLEKMKKREIERRKRANSNLGSARLNASNNPEDDEAILHSLLDKLKKDTLDVKVRRRSDRQRLRQRSTSVSMLQQSLSSAVPPHDSIYLQANKMLNNIQNDAIIETSIINNTNNSPTIIDFGATHRLATMDALHGGRRRLSASVAGSPSFQPLFYDKETFDSPLSAYNNMPPSAAAEVLSYFHQHNIHYSTTSATAAPTDRPLSACVTEPKQSISSQSHMSSTNPAVTNATMRPVRVRKTSKRPIFDHTLRTRARRLSTK